MVIPIKQKNTNNFNRVFIDFLHPYFFETTLCNKKTLLNHK